MKVLILEDDLIIARDIKEIILDIEKEVQIVNSYHEAMSYLQMNHIDLCLCDVNLNDSKTGIDFAKDISQLKPRIEFIFITAHSDDKTLSEMVSTEPLNLVVKPYTPNQIISSVKLAQHRINANKQDYDDLDLLTDKEKSILSLIAKGWDSKEISEKLCLSEKTVRNHRYNMSRKLNLPNKKNSLFLFAFDQYSK